MIHVVSVEKLFSFRDRMIDKKDIQRTFFLIASRTMNRFCGPQRLQNPKSFPPYSHSNLAAVFGVAL